LRHVALSVRRDPREVSENQARRLERIVAGGIGDHKRQLRLQQDGQLARQREHSAVGRDQTVPLSAVTVQREQRFPVVDVRQPWVDVPDRVGIAEGSQGSGAKVGRSPSRAPGSAGAPLAAPGARVSPVGFRRPFSFLSTSPDSRPTPSLGGFDSHAAPFAGIAADGPPGPACTRATRPWGAVWSLSRDRARRRDECPP
jgi:hypothetical protein